MDVQDEIAGHAANFTASAIFNLVRCLESTGALQPGQYETALRNTINAPAAQRDRLDYQFLANLLGTLEGTTPKVN